MIRALLWDVDGTLAETERDGHRVAFNEAFAAAGLPWVWDEARYGELLTTTGGRERILRDLGTRREAPATPAEREALAQALHVAKNRLYAQRIAAGAVTLRPGVEALIREAHARGLRQAIVTTTSRANVDALVDGLMPRLAACFGVRVCGEDVRAKKPDPEAHLRAVALLGLASPLEALAIEDAPAGAAAATAAEIPVVVTRSFYFDDAAAPIDQAIAIGPGFDRRRGWRPAAQGGDASRIGLDDLIDWHARMDLVSGLG